MTTDDWLDGLRVESITLSVPGDDAYVWIRGDNPRIECGEKHFGSPATFDVFVQEVAGFKGVSLQEPYAGPASPPKPPSELPYTPIDQVKWPTPKASD